MGVPACVLLSKPELAIEHAKRVLDAAGNRPGHVFNLGHGILQETPVETVQAVIEYVHSSTKR